MMRAAVCRPRGQATNERLEGEGKQMQGRGAEGGLGGGGTGGAAPRETGMWPEGALGAKAESAL